MNEPKRWDPCEHNQHSDAFTVVELADPRTGAKRLANMASCDKCGRTTEVKGSVRPHDRPQQFSPDTQSKPVGPVPARFRR